MKIQDVLNEYNVVSGKRQPSKGDLVYIPSQQAISEVVFAEKMHVKVMISDRVSMVLPYSQYMLLEKKEVVDND